MSRFNSGCNPNLYAVPAKDSIANLTMSDVIGNKTDGYGSNSLYGKIEILEEDAHSRTRTYPYLSAGIALAGAAGAFGMGSIIEIVPILAEEKATLTLTHAGSAAGGAITIDLNGVPYTVTVAAGTKSEVAAQLRTMTTSFGEWTVGGSGDTVTFARNGLSTTAVLKNLGATGITGTIAKTTTGAGIYKPFDIHAITVGICGKKDTYIITLYKGLAGYEERICSRRFTTTADNAAGGESVVKTPLMPAGTRISASIASVAGGTDRTMVVAVSYHWYD